MNRFKKKKKNVSASNKIDTTLNSTISDFKTQQLDTTINNEELMRSLIKEKEKMEKEREVQSMKEDPQVVPSKKEEEKPKKEAPLKDPVENPPTPPVTQSPTPPTPETQTKNIEIQRPSLETTTNSSKLPNNQDNNETQKVPFSTPIDKPGPKKELD